MDALEMLEIVSEAEKNENYDHTSILTQLHRMEEPWVGCEIPHTNLAEVLWSMSKPAPVPVSEECMHLPVFLPLNTSTHLIMGALRENYRTVWGDRHLLREWIWGVVEPKLREQEQERRRKK